MSLNDVYFNTLFWSGLVTGLCGSFAEILYWSAVGIGILLGGLIISFVNCGLDVRRIINE